MNHLTQPFADDVPMWTVYMALLIITIIIGGFLIAKRKDKSSFHAN
jgi:uncharacterized protein YneF (UPF0154 family)